MKKIIVLIICCFMIMMCSTSATELDFSVESADLTGNVEEQAWLCAIEGTGTIYDSISADSSYTLSYDNEIVTAATSTASSNKNFIIVPISLEENRTYKVSFDINMISHGGTARTKAKLKPSWLFTGTGKVTGNSADTVGSSHDGKAVELSISEDFTQFSSEITVKEINDRANMAFAMSTNPIKKGSSIVTAPTYKIKNLEVYERIDIIYSSGNICELADGAVAIPATVGVYPDGSNITTVKISSADMPYISKDDRWYIDGNKPWVDQNGNEYAAGAEIDVSNMNESIVLTPNLKTNLKTYTVSFNVEGLSSYPDSVSVFENDSIDLLNYGSAFASAEGIRFSGWTTEKNGTEVVTELVVTENIVLYPVINKNYDFAYDNAYSGTTVSGATMEKKHGGNSLGVTEIQSGAGAYVSLGNLRLPTSMYKEIKIIFDAHSSEAVINKFTPEFVSSFKGVYINTGSFNGADGQIKLLTGTDICNAKIIQENDKNYLEVTIAADKSEYWNGILNFIRIDAYIGGPDYFIRRVEFVPYEKFEEKVINLVGFKVPETGDKATSPENVTDEMGIAQVESVDWSPELLPGKVFDANISYSAKVVVRPSVEYDKVFAEDTIVKIDGEEVESQMNEDGSIEFELSYLKTTDVKRYSVTFDSTGLKPESVPTGIVTFEGKTFYVSAYNTGASSDSKLRFNGWAMTPGETDLFKAVDSIMVTEDVTLYPILSYDINLTCTENQKNWAFGSSVGQFTDDGYLLITQTGAGTGVTAKLSNMNLYTKLFSAVKLYFGSETNTTFSVIYFNRTGEISETTERYLRGEAKVTDPETGYDVVRFPTKVPNWDGTLSSIRLDLNKLGAITELKAIVFEPAEKFEEKVINLVGFKTPAMGEVVTLPVNVTDETGIAQVDSIKWSPEPLPGKIFDAGVSYSAKVVVRPSDKYNKLFADDTVIKVDGTEVESKKNEDGTIEFELSYPKTSGSSDTKKYSVTFDDTGLKPGSVPTSVLAFEGKAFNVSACNDAVSADSKIRFNGWAMTPGETDLFKALDTIMVTEDITLYPILSYDINLSCAENQKNWAFGNSFGQFTDDGYMVVTQTGTGTGVTAKLTNLELSTRLFASVKIYYGSKTNETFSVIYFNRVGEGSETTERYLRSEGKKFDSEKGYNYVRFSTDVPNWSGTLGSIRLDLNKLGAISEVKAIVFEYPPNLDADNIVVNGIQNPEPGAVFNSKTIKETTGNAVFEEIQWTPTLRDGRFEAEQEYTAKVFFAPEKGFRFDPERQITVTFGETVSNAEIDSEGRLYASFSFEKTGSYVPFTMKIEGDSSFYVDEITKQYKVLFEGGIPDKAVTWSVDKTEYFSIDERGVLSVVKNGAVKAKVKATSKYNPNVYAEFEIETFIYDATFEIAGRETLSKENRTEQYRLNITSGTSYDCSAVWSVDNTNIAQIDKNTGRLTPIRNGTVVITAVSNYNYSSCTFKVNIINHRDFYNITFADNTTDTVTGMPKKIQARLGDAVSISEIVEKPSRKGYVFLGWSVYSDNISGVDDMLTVEGDITLYATWGKTIFDSSATGDYVNVVELGDVTFAEGEDTIVVKITGESSCAGTLTFTDINGNPDSVEFKTAFNGYAAVNLDGQSAISDAKVVISSYKSIEKIFITTLENAIYTQNFIYENEKPQNHEINIHMTELPNPKPEDFIVENVINENEKFDFSEKENDSDKIGVTEKAERFGFVHEGRILFEDVKTAHWFRDEVITAYKLGLVKGRTEDLFDPYGNVTVAEAITLAVRLNYAYNGLIDDVEQPKEKWYTNYIAKAVELGIIEENQFDNYDVSVQRRDVAVIMSNSVPRSYLNLINKITSIPDVPNTDPDFEVIRRLYNVGIIQGDGEFNFYPDSNITRAEMAAIINRVAIPENRKRNITEKERLSNIFRYTAVEIASGATLVNCENDKLVFGGESASATASTKDPIVFLDYVVRSFNASNASQVRVYMKWDTSVVENPIENGCKMYFTTGDNDKWHVNNYLSATWDGTFDENGFAELVFDCTSNKQFQGLIPALRFDPFDIKASFEIREIVIE